MPTTAVIEDPPATAIPMPRLLQADETPVTMVGQCRSSLTASEVSDLVGDLDLGAARAHHVELAAVVAELARSAGTDWPWTHDDPTVSLLRALALMALIAPDAVSGRAVALRHSLEAIAPTRAAKVSS